MLSIHAVLFDLDGVLIDSRTSIARSINHVFGVHGLPTAPPESLYGYIGPPLERTFEQLLRDHGGDPADAPLLVATYRERYGATAAAETLVYDGVRELLDGIATAGLPLGVATLKPTELARPLIAALGIAAYFRAIEGPALDDPDELKDVTAARALAALGSDAARTPLVGDRRSDITAAHALGMPAIAALWGIGDRNELAGADYAVSTPAELEELLLGG